MRILAPSFESIGSTVVVKVEAENYKPVNGALVYVISPTNEVLTRVTDSSGQISFSADEEGWYNYNAPDQDVISRTSTYVAKETSHTLVCGDGICSRGEDCGSCQADCGLCPSGNKKVQKPIEQGINLWIIIALVVFMLLSMGVLVVGGALFYGYKKDKLPFVKKEKLKELLKRNEGKETGKTDEKPKETGKTNGKPEETGGIDGKPEAEEESPETPSNETKPNDGLPEFEKPKEDR